MRDTSPRHDLAPELAILDALSGSQRSRFAPLSTLLKASGHDVRTAFDGPTAVHAALEHLPDVVLLDIGLPDLNGYEVAARLRRKPTLLNVVLVALTDYGQEADRQEALQAGFDHHLVKPTDFGRLERSLAGASARSLRHGNGPKVLIGAGAG